MFYGQARQAQTRGPWFRRGIPWEQGTPAENRMKPKTTREMVSLSLPTSARTPPTTYPPKLQQPGVCPQEQGSPSPGPWAFTTCSNGPTSMLLLW